MALILKTDNPKAVLEKIKSDIRRGFIKTWIIDDEGDLTISNIKWAFKAWFEPMTGLQQDELGFGIIPSKKVPITNEIYGVFHGRLASTLIAHYDALIDDLRITPNYDSTYDIYTYL